MGNGLIARTKLLALAAVLAVLPAQGQAQEQTPAPVSKTDAAAPTAPTAERPLPDIPALMHDVETNERKAEAIEKDYLYRSSVTRVETDSHGQTKKTTVEVYDDYWANGVPVHRLMQKNGKDLSAEEVAKENERIEKESVKMGEKRAKADAEGKETDPRGDDVITVSRLLELGAFTNPRRVELNGRDTIAVDYAGDPRAKTRNRNEDVIRDMLGTVWVDEQDRVLVRAEGHFVNAFKVGGGLIVNIQKDTRFAMRMARINNEVWLPAHIEAQGAARALLFFNFSGSIQINDSDFRKFKATSTILPGVSAVESPDTQKPADPPK